MSNSFKTSLLVALFVVIAYLTIHRVTDRRPASIDVDRYTKLIPHKGYRNGLKEYFKSINNIHGGANESIEQANIEFAKKSPCFSEVAYKFYDEVLEEDLSAMKSTFLNMEDDDSKLVGRPDLNSVIGSGATKNLQPGWLWQKAKSASGNDTNLAMWLVGLCGHDDGVSEMPNIKNVKNRFDLVANRLRIITEHQKKVRNELTKYTSSDPRSKRLLNFIQYLEDLKNDENLDEIRCPKLVMHTPQSLGEQVDISDELKRQIIHIQGPQLGGNTLPAKYYHIMGAAFLICKAKQKGLANFGPFLERAAARGYRGQRMCEVLRNITARENAFMVSNNINDSEKHWINKIVSIHKSGICSGDDVNYYEINECKEIMEVFGSNHIFNRGSSGSKYVEKYVKRFRAKIDAAKLWSKWYPKLKIQGLGEFCINKHQDRPNSGFDYGVISYLRHGNNCANKWNEKRCNEALQIMDEWEVDFLWTENQHEIGAKFGEENCSKLTSFEEIEVRSCDALNIQHSSKPQSNKSKESDAVR